MEDGVTFQDPRLGGRRCDSRDRGRRDDRAERRPARHDAHRRRDTVIKSGSQIVDSAIGERCVDLGQRARELDGRRRRADRALRPPSGRLRDRRRRRDRQLRRGEEQPLRRPVQAAPLLLPRRRRHRRGREHRRRDDHRQLRRASASTAPIIGDGAFIGSDTILRAPVDGRRGRRHRRRSVVTRDVPPGKIAVGVPARIRERRAPA